MGTQGVLSVVKNDKVLRKIVCGCDGGNLLRLAKWLETNPTYDARVLREKCYELLVGCGECFVLQVSSRNFLRGFEGKVECAIDSDLKLLFWEKFEDPVFNPRWHYGTADYRLVVDITDPNKVIVHGREEDEESS